MLVEGYRRNRLSGNSRLGRPRLPVTVKGEIDVLSAVFNKAIENDLIGLNPCRKIRWGRGQTDCRRERVLTHEEEDRLFRELERYPEPKAAAEIALNTGLRRMGILKLKVEDFDPKRRALSYTAKGGKVKVIPLNVEACAVLAQLAADPAPGGYLFHNRNGHNLTGAKGAFHLAMGRAKVKGFRFHDFRHTFASRVRSHTDAFTVRDLLCHADIRETNIYTNPQFDEMRRAVEALSSRKGAGKVLEFKAG